MSLVETTVGKLTGYDIGKRIAVGFDGQVYVGFLSNVAWINYDSKRGVECYRLEVKNEKLTFNLQSVPLDYHIQIDHGESRD